MEALKQFVIRSAAKPFVWGQDDCALWLADWWLVRHGGRDPAASLRGRYGSREECHDLLRRRGGLTQLVASVAKRAGAIPTDDPGLGAIGIIEVKGNQFAAICIGIMHAGKCWGVRGEGSGVAFIMSPQVIKAWAV